MNLYGLYPGLAIWTLDKLVVQPDNIIWFLWELDNDHNFDTW